MVDKLAKKKVVVMAALMVVVMVALMDLLIIDVSDVMMVDLTVDWMAIKQLELLVYGMVLLWVIP